MLSINDFIKKYDGVAGVGNTDANKGECVGLIAVWVDNLGLSHIWGHAKDLFANAPDSEWNKIENASNVYPKSGDIMCWGGSWGGGYGHTGVVESSSPSTDSFKCFEQNYPTGSAPHIVTRKSWNGIIGWLSPKKETFDCEAQLDETLRENLKLTASYNELNEKYGIEVSAKQKIIDDQQKHISEMSYNATLEAKRYADMEKERNGYREAYKTLQGTHEDYVNERIADDLALNRKLADSHVRLTLAEKKFEEMSIIDFIIIKYFKGGAK